MKIKRSGVARTRPAAILALMLGATTALGCGSEDATKAASGASAEGGGGSSSTSTNTSGAGESGGGPQDPSAVCQSPSGYQVCGGTNHCPYWAETCQTCTASEDDEPAGRLGVCSNDAYDAYHKQQVGNGLCVFCPDGDVCFDKFNYGSAAFCIPYELGSLIAQNGGAEKLRYADHSLWTGEPLPEPDTCPALADVQLCGGKCGGCTAGDVCTGRSPVHPYGLCASAQVVRHCDGIDPCDPDAGCFTWKVQSKAQIQADWFGFCLPLATCKAAAASIPGGGFCDAP